MPWVCHPGGTLLVPSGETHHLFVILNAPADFETYPRQSSVLVPFSTIKGPHDATRVVQPGAHPFLRVPSFVAYRHARMERAAVLERHVEAGMYIPREPVSEQLTQELIAGLYVSPLAPGYLKKLKLV